MTKLYDQVPLTVCIAADARMESLPAFPQARKLGPQRPVFGRIPVLPRASDVSQHCTAGHLANSLVLPALERIGVKGKMVDQNHDDVLMKLFRTRSSLNSNQPASLTRMCPEGASISKRDSLLGLCYMAAEHVLSLLP